MLKLADLVERIRGYHPAADVEIVSRAYDYSVKAHTGQKRKSGDPYFIHPASVAGIITELRLDTASICAGLLHDVVEDTPAPSMTAAKTRSPRRKTSSRSSETRSRRSSTALRSSARSTSHRRKIAKP